MLRLYAECSARRSSLALVRILPSREGKYLQRRRVRTHGWLWEFHVSENAPSVGVFTHSATFQVPTPLANGKHQGRALSRVKTEVTANYRGFSVGLPISYELHRTSLMLQTWVYRVPLCPASSAALQPACRLATGASQILTFQCDKRGTVSAHRLEDNALLIRTRLPCSTTIYTRNR